MMGRREWRGKAKGERSYPPPIQIKKTYSFMEEDPNAEVALP